MNDIKKISNVSKFFFFLNQIKAKEEEKIRSVLNTFNISIIIIILWSYSMRDKTANGYRFKHERVCVYVWTIAGHALLVKLQ